MFLSKYFTSPVLQFDSILAIINYHSYKMLIEPASKVSVPFAVVKLILSNAPLSEALPPTKMVLASFPVPNTPMAFQSLPLNFTNINDPNREDAAVLLNEIAKPFERFEDPVAPPMLVEATPVYPVIKNEPDPILMRIVLVPLAETLFKLTVIRLTQLGIPVKLIAVPLVVACTVPRVNGCDNLAGVIDPSAGTVENVPVVAAVTLPFASTVMNGIAVTLP